jgi:hypothetical protein
VPRCPRPAVAAGDPALTAALKHGVARDQPVLLEDAQLVGEQVHLDGAAAGAVRHAVEIAVDRDHAVAGDPPLQAQRGLERAGWQRLEEGPLLSEMLGDDAAGGRVQPSVGHLVQPLPELGIEVVEVAEAAGEEEVLAHVAERPLHLALALRPVGPARLGQEAVVAGALEQGPVVGDPLRVLAGDRGAHAVVQDPGRHAAERLERRHVAAEHRRQILVHDEARPQHPAVPEHEREQPDDADHAGLVGELGAELGEVDLRLLPGRGLEALLEAGRRGRPDVAQEVGQPGVAARVAEVAQLAVQPPTGQLGESRDALAQVAAERVQQRRPGLARTVDRRLQAALEVFAHGLAVEARPPGDGGHREALPV